MSTRLSAYLDPSKVFRTGSQVINIDPSKSPYYSQGGEVIYVDTTLGQVVIYLPKNPTNGMPVTIVDAAYHFDLANCLVDGNGNNVNGSTERFRLQLKAITYTFRFDDGKNNWILDAGLGYIETVNMWAYDGDLIMPGLNGWVSGTRNIVPRENNQGNIGQSNRRWAGVYSGIGNITTLTTTNLTNTNKISTKSLSSTSTIDTNELTVSGNCTIDALTIPASIVVTGSTVVQAISCSSISATSNIVSTNIVQGLDVKATRNISAAGNVTTATLNVNNTGVIASLSGTNINYTSAGFTNLSVTNTIQGTTLQTYYADYAEYFETGGELPIGTVVKICSSSDVEVSHTESINDIPLGVVSENPGVCINSEKSKDKKWQPIGVKGRVRTRVKGIVHKGDILVPSSMGYAISCDSSNPLAVHILGIAMEDHLDEGTGLILAFIK